MDIEKEKATDNWTRDRRSGKEKQSNFAPRFWFFVKSDLVTHGKSEIRQEFDL
jgi:hypothetical protein